MLITYVMSIGGMCSAHGEMIDMKLQLEASREYRDMWEDNIEVDINIRCENME